MVQFCIVNGKRVYINAKSYIEQNEIFENA